MASAMTSLLVLSTFVLFHSRVVEANSQKLKANYKNASSFLNLLLKDYDKRIRPFHQEDAVRITVSAEIVSFKELDELNMQFGMDMFFRQTWLDPRLAHDVNPSIILPGEQRKQIWLPDTFFYNVKEAKHHTVPDDNSRVEVLMDGRVIYSSRITMSSSCAMDFRNYPMDNQTCSWEVLSYSFKNDMVDYTWGKKSLYIFDDSLAQFSLVKYHTYRKVHKYISGSYTHLVATFLFHRRLAYSFIQVYIPTAMVVGLSYLSFWVQKSAVPARIALGITTVLTLVTLMGSLRASVPKVSYIKAIDWYLIVGFIFIFGALLEYVLVLSRVERKSKDKMEDENVVPDKQLENVNEGEPECVPLEEFPRRGETSMKHAITTWCKKKIAIKDDSTQTDICDRVCRIVYPISYLIFNIVYWAVYVTNV